MLSNCYAIFIINNINMLYYWPLFLNYDNVS
jgi:hypothetical protein